MSRFRRSAEGRGCTLRLPGICNHDSATVVLAHARTGGMARKCPDTAAFFACSACHDAYDRRVPCNLAPADMRAEAVRAIVETHEIWWREGLME